MKKPLAAPVFVLSDAEGNQLNPLPGGSARGFLFQPRPSAEGGDQLIDLALCDLIVSLLTHDIAAGFE